MNKRTIYLEDAVDALNALFMKQIIQFGYKGYEDADDKTKLVCDGISESIGCVLNLPSAQPECTRECMPMYADVSDCISRQAAIDEAYEIIIDGQKFEVVQVETLMGLPPAQPHWIPVTEMMPEKQTEVLVSTFNDVKTAYLNELGWFMDCYGDKVKCVTAWMPLPPCYEEEEE